jgi:hypothetical protein
MAVQFEASTPDDLDAIASLLASAFNAPIDAPFVDRDLLRWKYFDSFGRGSTPRSHVLKQDGVVVAHCVAWPLTLSLARTSGRTCRLNAVCFADWAGSPRLPGSGSILVRKLMQRAPVSVVAGGSDATRRTIPRLGFALHHTIDLFARVVRPLRQARIRPSAGLLKDAARLARNSAWSARPLGPTASGWAADPVSSFASVVEHDASVSAVEHDAEYLNYWLRCPAATIAGFELQDGGSPAGWFVLSRVGAQARIAGVGLRRATPDHWEQAYRLATRAAAEDPQTCEVVCAASTPATRAALAACGFEPRGGAPLFGFDKDGVLADSAPLVWCAIDDDTAYLFDPSTPFVT